MENWIKNIRVQNFKSLKDVSLECERINLFVGKPNVGKSNLLEAIALLGLNYDEGIRTGMKKSVRYEQMADLFYDQNIRDEEVIVESPEVGTAKLTLENKAPFCFKELSQREI
ncbi:MAG: AAA family ATPase [Lewinellaceae bacterium]|nr:AAA family ATPase [Lewinellaceae bacterium]